MPIDRHAKLLRASYRRGPNGRKKDAKPEAARLSRRAADRDTAERLAEAQADYTMSEPMSARLLIRGHARGVFETRIAELAADPDGHGLDADEAAAYQLADRCYSDGWLAVPDGADDREALWRLFTDLDDSLEYFHLSPCGGCGAPMWQQPCACCGYYPRGNDPRRL